METIELTKEEIKTIKNDIIPELLKMNNIYSLKARRPEKEVFKMTSSSGIKIFLFINKNTDTENRNCFVIPKKFSANKVVSSKDDNGEIKTTCYVSVKEYDIITDKEVVEKFVSDIYSLIDNDIKIKLNGIRMVVSSEDNNKDLPVYKFYNHNGYDKKFFYESELDCFFKDNLKDMVEVLRDRDDIVSKILDFYVKILGNITAIPTAKEYESIPYFPTIIKDVNFKAYNPVYLMINCCSYDFLNTLIEEIKAFENDLLNAKIEDEKDTTIEEGIEKDLKNIRYILKEIKNEFKEGYLNR